MHPYDAVTVDGQPVGLSTWLGYSAGERKMLSLAVLEEPYTERGTEVALLWGEPDGGTSKPTVERHVQMEIRAIVHPVPYVEAVRSSYGDTSWRRAGVA
jgi:syringate O-demethylase